MQEQLIALVRKEPGLLSWNISTLITRVVAVSQALQLPPRLRVTLLTYNRPLLSHVTALPGRIELLRKLLHLPGAPHSTQHAATAACIRMALPRAPVQLRSLMLPPPSPPPNRRS